MKVANDYWRSVQNRTLWWVTVCSGKNMCKNTHGWEWWKEEWWTGHWWIVLLPIRMLGKLLDVKLCWGENARMSEHFWVEALLKLVGGWRSARRMEGVRNVFKVSELNNWVEKRAYQESLYGKCGVWRGWEVESVGKEWEKFRDIIMECTNEWQWCMLHEMCMWAEKKWEWMVGRAVAENRSAFE